VKVSTLRLGLAVIGGFIACAVMAHLDRPLWELLLSLVLPGFVLYLLDWALDRIWPRPDKES
jgi:hypothetical protein